MRVDQVTPDRAKAIASTLDPATNSWLRTLSRGPSPDVRLFAADDGGVLAIVGNEARLGHPLTVTAATALARATANIPILQAWGATSAVRAVVAARDEPGWQSIFVGSEMIKSAPSSPRTIAGEVRRASELGRGSAAGGPTARKADDRGPGLPPPFDGWMRAFVEEEFEPGTSPPRVSAEELCVWIADGEARAMAGTLARGADAMRIVTVYTPKAARGAGWAGALVTAIADGALRDGRPFVTLDVADENIPARRAYERAGFRSILATQRWLRREG
jgi:GNAT superfamily N-acetyltransferase